jgi:hypothetical protein
MNTCDAKTIHQPLGLVLRAIGCLILAIAEANASNILFVSDFTTDTNIASVLLADGHIVTTVTNDYVSATESNPTLQNPLSAYHAVYWSAGESNFGSTHGNAATFSNLTSYVNNGGRVFVTGADSVADPSDPNMVAFVGGSGSALDTTSSPGAVVNIVNSLTTGVVDIRGVVPTGGGLVAAQSFSDLDAIRNLVANTVGVVPSSGTAGSWQWTLRTLGSGQIAFVSNGTFNFSPLDASWENTAAGGAGAYNAAIRNFAVPEPCTLTFMLSAACAASMMFRPVWRYGL